MQKTNKLKNISSKLNAQFDTKFTASDPISVNIKITRLMQGIRQTLFKKSCSPSQLERIRTELQEQICHYLEDKKAKKLANDLSWVLLEKLPEIRRLLNTDAKAAFTGDPACETTHLPSLCYPSLFCLSYHRISHELYKLKIPTLPRVISELAHSQTGIDIHPGATIGESFFIDHGTGVVIGETTIVGNHVKIYHGVTLGAKSFPKTSDGSLVKGIERHPIIGNNVTIYSNAVILGRITIGDHSVIGGNVCLMESVPPYSKIYLTAARA